MNLKFELNKEYLLYSALIWEIPPKDWEVVQDKLWNNYRKGYQLLQGHLGRILIQPDPKISMAEATENMYKLVGAGLKEPLFTQLIAETEIYKKWLEVEWAKNKVKVIKELKDILRIELPQVETKVLVIHNKMNGGMHLNQNVFMWGHSEDWPNYSLVYLAHEYLHDIFGQSNFEHAIIELIADNELRIRLVGEGEYFKVNGKSLIDYEVLKPIEQKLLPEWQKYLADPTLTIHDFIRINSIQTN